MILAPIRELRQKALNAWEITYEGKGVSMNEYYSQGHWSRRHSIKNKYKPILHALIRKAGVTRCKTYGILVMYNSNHDPDNVTGFVKIFNDALVEMELVEDDKKHFCKFVGIMPDLDLKHNTFKFIVYKIA